MITRVSKIDDEKFPTGSFSIELEAPTNLRTLLFLLQTRYAECSKILEPLTATQAISVGFRGQDTPITQFSIVDNSGVIVAENRDIASPALEKFTGVGYTFEGEDIIRIGTTDNPDNSQIWDIVDQNNGGRILKEIRRALLNALASEWSKGIAPTKASSSIRSTSLLHSRSSGESLEQ